MRLSLCNEVLRPMDLSAQCAFARSVGYDGLEIAPFTLSEAPHRMPAGEIARLRAIVADHGLAVTGLHWLLVTPQGLSITTADSAVAARTRDVILGLMDLAAGLGARVMVHGSPAQRNLPDGEPRAAAVARVRDLFAGLAPEAAARGLTYCLEPLSPAETGFLTTVAEAAQLVEAIGHPAVRTMVDTSAAAQGEAESVPALLSRWLPTGLIAHIQLNDRNRRGPGEGDDRFAPILQTLQELGYDGDLAVEPFIYAPDGPATAARAAGYIHGLMEALGVTGPGSRDRLAATIREREHHA